MISHGHQRLCLKSGLIWQVANVYNSFLIDSVVLGYIKLEMMFEMS